MRRTAVADFSRLVVQTARLTAADQTFEKHPVKEAVVLSKPRGELAWFEHAYSLGEGGCRMGSFELTSRASQ